MSRISPVIEIKRQYALRWLIKHGWREIHNASMPFAPSLLEDPIKHTKTHLEAAFEIQLIRETGGIS